MEPKLAKHLCSQLSLQKQTELAGVKLLNLTADDLQLLPPHLPDQGGETDPSIVCLLELYLILNLNGVVQPCVLEILSLYTTKLFYQILFGEIAAWIIFILIVFFFQSSSWIAILNVASSLTFPKELNNHA